MKKLKNLVIIFFLFIFVFRESNVYSEINNKIIAKVGDQIISSYELKNKIKLILFLSKQELNQSNIDQIKKVALRSLIDNKLKKNEVVTNKIQIENNVNVKNFLKNTYANFNTNEKGFKTLLLQNNIDFELYLNEIKYEFAWQKLIFRLYKDKINLNEQEIINELNTFIKIQKNLETFQLAEIVILAVSKSEDNKNIEEIKKQIQIDGFNDTAIKYSQSPSAFEGGKIGWVNSKSLSSGILSVVKNLKIGEVSKPFYQTNSIVFLKLLNKKKENINDINIEKVKINIITRKKNELLNIFSNNHLSKIKNKTFIRYNE